MSFKIEIWGDYAMFTRPEFKVERYSYDVITPSAARGFLEAIYWTPGFRYVIDRIHVLNPIQDMNICKNEIEGLKVKSSNVKNTLLKGKMMEGVDGNKNRVQRQNRVLRNVRYVIEAHIETTRLAQHSVGHFQKIVVERISKGKFHSQPFLGCRDYTGYFGPCEEIPPCDISLRGERELGNMLWGKDYSKPNIPPQIFRAVMRDGVISVPAPGSEEVLQ